MYLYQLFQICMLILSDRFWEFHRKSILVSNVREYLILFHIIGVNKHIHSLDLWSYLLLRIKITVLLKIFEKFNLVIPKNLIFNFSYEMCLIESLSQLNINSPLNFIYRWPHICNIQFLSHFKCYQVKDFIYAKFYEQNFVLQPKIFFINFVFNSINRIWFNLAFIGGIV